MNRLIAIAVAALLWTVAVFCVGWKVRDGSADASTAGVAATQQAARADQAEAARTTDHANATASGAVQQQRAEQADKSASDFKIIERKVVEYVQANPDPSGCDLDGDGLRAWREANAGSAFDGAGPGDPGRPAGEQAEGPAAAGQR